MSFAFWTKQCQNGLKIDVEPPSGISMPTVCSILRNRVFSTAIAIKSYLAIGMVKLGQMMPKRLELNMYTLHGYV